MDTRRIATVLLLGAVLVLGAGCKNSIQTQINGIGGTPLSSGTAHVDITGDTETSFDAPLEKAQVGTAVTVFIYRSESGDLFSVAGLGVNGSAKTNNSLDLTVTTGEVAASSSEGECTITIAHGEANSESGTATCSNLDSSQGSIDLKATFSAAP